MRRLALALVLLAALPASADNARSRRTEITYRRWLVQRGLVRPQPLPRKGHPGGWQRPFRVPGDPFIIAHPYVRPRPASPRQAPHTLR